jgi:hypothetical protein
MKSYDESDEYDNKEWAKLKGEPWMRELLEMNPEYVFWGPGDDYMKAPGDGWDAALEFSTWKEFAGFQLNDMNECVHFYFEVNRKNRQCMDCLGNGFNAETRELEDSFYAFGRPSREAWNDKITQEEVQVLLDNNRLFQFTLKSDKPPTAAEVNEAQRSRPALGSHDGINKAILVEARAKRLGVYGLCETCNGEGHIYEEPNAYAGLVLWVLHPRKGASRGVSIERLEREDLPQVFEFLTAAAKRNAGNFEKVVSACEIKKTP